MPSANTFWELEKRKKSQSGGQKTVFVWSAETEDLNLPYRPETLIFTGTPEFFDLMRYQEAEGGGGGPGFPGGGGDAGPDGLGDDSGAELSPLASSRFLCLAFAE